MSSFGVFYRPTVGLFVIFPEENRSLHSGKCRYWPGRGNTKRKPRASIFLLQFLSYACLDVLSQHVSRNEHYKISNILFVLILLHGLVNSHFVTYKIIKTFNTIRITIMKVMAYWSNLSHFPVFPLRNYYWAFFSSVSNPEFMFLCP